MSVIYSRYELRLMGRYNLLLIQDPRARYSRTCVYKTYAELEPGKLTKLS